MKKRNIFKNIVALASSATFLVGCGSSDKPVTPEPTPEPEPVVPDPKIVTPISLLSPENGSSVDICSSYITDYLNISDANEGLNNLKAYIAKRKVGDISTDASALPVSLKWESNGSANYTVTIGTKEDLSDGYEVKVSGLTPYFNFYNAIPNSTYYWKVKGNENKDDSKINCFKTNDSMIRPIYADGGNNMRDLGGWKTEDGYSVNYGKLYRGNCLNGYLSIATLTQDGINTFVNQLGMKSEIDLRTSGSDDLSQSKNWFNEDGLYLKATIDQYTRIFSSEICEDIKKTDPNQSNLSSSTIAKVSIKSIFETLANEDNYPIYMHCNVGADRTGTMSFLINGLLGVSYENLAKDFEITSFCQKSSERYRSDVIQNDDGTYKFGTTGVYMNVAGQNFIAFDALYNAMMKYYANEGETLADAIEKYLVSYIGISDLTVTKIKNILKNGYHDDTYDNLIELENRQDIDLSNATCSLSLEEEKFDSISKISLNGVSLGTDINNIDTTKLSSFSGDNDVFVFGLNEESPKVVKIPVSIITEKISTIQRFRELFEYKNNTTLGYYKLANDIGGEDENFSNDFNDAEYGSCQGYGSYRGFQGTLDGAGYTISGKSTRLGMFGVIGSQGVVKNLNIVNNYYVSNNVKQHSTIALSIYGTIENVNVKLTNDCPTKAIKSYSWFGLISSSNSENLKVKNLVIDAEDYYIDSIFGGAKTNGLVYNDSNIQMSVSCKGIDELGHYGANKYSLFDLTNLGGNLSTTCQESNSFYRNANVAEIYLGKKYEDNFVIDSIYCGDTKLEKYTFIDGEISIEIGDWVPVESSATLLVTLHNNIGLNLKLSVPVLIKN